MFKSKRGKNLNHLLMNGQTEVGEAWKVRVGRGFGVRLHGIYWRRGMPNTQGGTTTTWVPRLKDAVQLAERIFTSNSNAS